MTGELLLDYSSAFMIGLLGGVHCLGMCGGISASLSMAVPVGASFRLRQSFLIVGFNLGRIASYTLLGALLGLLTTQAVAAWTALAPVLRTLAGLLLILMGLSLGQFWQGIQVVERIGAPVWRHLAPLTRRFTPVQRPSQALTLGLLWGWLPCGLVYSTLGWAALQPSVSSAALTMFSFGLGTLPAMLATGFAASRLQHWRQHRGFRQLVGVCLVIFGVWTLPITTQWLARLG
ncbi:sulfite exporter TauE/SafE family protein [Marinobacter halodurans]|uniref:Sulfite exporter TauE/SafE family protein n=1 Tax=Marinobacter halodurans TaxID=2528979 RepID=A0ABY1ZQD8_9GAMM|nr:sulfite exporter TauE/SafE family protein [Marinobacter halodurans]TBW59163.1 sulfite exporter TauE/SafE family protein [Marinobacter halodurans]